MTLGDRAMTPAELKERAKEIRVYKSDVARRANAKYRARHREKVLAAKKEAYQRDWTAWTERELRTKYNMTPEDYRDLLALQGGGCAICGNKSAGGRAKRRLYVDHDHATGLVRGLLCNKHNWGVGHFSDNPELLRKAADYLEHPPAQQKEAP